MTRAEYIEARDYLLRAAVILAPTSEDKTACTALLRSIEREPSISHEQVLCHFVGSIYDGLAFGNWPEHG